MTPSFQTRYVDREGDVWIPNGEAHGGELRLKCPEPQAPEDAGDGESFPWTRSLVESFFGPLVEQTAVAL